MPTAVIRIDMPPQGTLELSGQGSNPTDEQMAEEMEARKAFLDAVTPALAALPDRPTKRGGNVSQVELRGANVWSKLNLYLVLLTYDVGALAIEWETILPPGAKVTTVGSYVPLDAWRAREKVATP